MTPNPQAAIHHKCRELILLLQINLNHFPRHEKYGLCQEIRQCVYGVLAGIVECQKRYHNKTSLTKLDVQHEQLRVFIILRSSWVTSATSTTNERAAKQKRCAVTPL